MQPLRTSRRPIVWLALVAVLALALMPSLARAWVSSQAAQGGDWVELCTAEGTRWVQLRDGEPVQQLAMPDACDFCQLQAQLPVLPTAPMNWALPPVLAEAPTLFWQAPRRLAVWSSASSRGPPSFAQT